jgi:hypothetical protein
MTEVVCDMLVDDALVLGEVMKMMTTMVVVSALCG